MSHRRLNPRTIVILAVIVCLVAAAVFLLLRFFPSFGSRAETTPNTAQQDTDSPAVSVGGSEEPVSSQASDQKIGSLTVAYSDAELIRVDGDNGLVTLLSDAAQALPRLDLQNLDGSLQDLTDEEIQQLAVGMVQAYYVDAPVSDTISVTVDQTLLHAYLVDVPAASDAPALSAQVRFLEASDGLWCLVLLHAADQDAPAALLSAYETVVAA